MTNKEVNQFIAENPFYALSSFAYGFTALSEAASMDPKRAALWRMVSLFLSWLHKLAWDINHGSIK